MGLLLFHRAQLPLEDYGDVVDHAEYCRNRGYRSRGPCGCDAYGPGLSDLASLAAAPWQVVSALLWS